MNQSIKGKTAIITGGGTGIGRGIALALAREGGRVLICGRRKDRLEATVSAIRADQGEARFVQADVSELADVQRVIKAALEAYGRIDILINNAGIEGGGHLHEMEVEDWDRVMRVNLRGPFLMTRQVLPIMRQQRSGQIINISSESGIEYYHGDAAYGLSKHGLNAFGEYTQRENQDFNIRVNTICPGMVVTEMSENEPGLDHSKCLYPEDIADLTLWLLTRRENIKIGTPILIQTMLNPWEST
jgi:3-oxoacyl-[acyl-carrier protein] reductase